MGTALPSTWGNDGTFEPCWYINPCFPSQEGWARPLQSQEKVGFLLSVEGPRTLLFSPLPCLGPFFWGGVVLSVQAVVGGAWATGRQRSCGKCVYIEWPGETMLKSV